MEFLPQMEEQRLRGCFNFGRFYRRRLDFPRRLRNRFHSSREKTLGTGAGQITIVNMNSSVHMRISWKAASYSAQLTSRTYRIRKSKGDSSEPGSKTGLKKLRIELNDLTFSLRNPLSLVPILSKSLKCNSPKTVVNKKAKSSRMTCLFRRKLLYYGCFYALSILNLILLSEGHTIHFIWVVLGIWSWMQTISNSWRLSWFSSPVCSDIVRKIYIAITWRVTGFLKGCTICFFIYWNINQ